MNDSVINSLTKEKMQQLSAAVGAKSAENDEKVEADKYDWRQPRYFSNKQLKKLDEFTKETAVVIAEKLSSLFNAKYSVSISSTVQHFAGQFISQTNDRQKDFYYLDFGTDKRPLCGVVGIPPQTAIGLVTQLLGDSEAEQDANRGLSQLEESLLLDIASVFVRALFDANNSCDFQPSKTIIQSQIPLQFEDTEEICEMTFEIRKDESESSDQVHVLIECSKLDIVAGKTNQTEKDSAVNDISQIIVNHLQEISVPVTVQLGATMLNFEQIMTLQEDDVILLNKKVQEDADLVLQGQKLFRGQLARSNGNKTLVITSVV